MANLRECNVCMGVLDLASPNVNAVHINGSWACRECLNIVVLRVLEGHDDFPPRMNGLPIDFAMHFHQMDDDLIASYRQREEELSIYPYLRVFCACTKFIGKKVTADPIRPLMTVDECPACSEFTCMACMKPLDKEHLSANASDHGCKEKVEAIEKLHQDLLDGEDRGKKYQICPHCRRYMQLASACNHISCECRGQFCYPCGVATLGTHHWGTELWQCPQYPSDITEAQTALLLLSSEDWALAIREALLDAALGGPPDLEPQDPPDDLAFLAEFNGGDFEHLQADPIGPRHLRIPRPLAGLIFPVGHEAMDWAQWRDNAQARLDQMAWQGRVANAELDLDRQEAVAGQHGVREVLEQYNFAHQRLINPEDQEVRQAVAERIEHYRHLHRQDEQEGEEDDQEDGQAARRRLDDVGMRPRPQRQRRIRTVLHGIQPVGQVPNPGYNNNEIINPQQPERDLEREREEAEMAHDDALRAAERLDDGYL